MKKIVGTLLLGCFAAACSLFAPLPKRAAIEERLAAIPVAGAPFEQPVTIRWNAFQVPFIEARTDTDLALALGIVHAHLRLGQMELLRHISQGRLAELAGPVAVDIDKSLRILGFGRAAPAMAAAMPPETRAWMEAFVAGINHYVANVETLPHEFDVGGLDRAPWQVVDLLTIGRLASTDVNWLSWFSLLKFRDRPDWPALWQQLVNNGTASVPSFGEAPDSAQALLNDMLTGIGRAGSNSVAVAGTRTDTGAALIASDPHLGVQLPNAWLMAGYKSPSYHAVGFMIPGLPFMALGRNPWIAWGGTNMRAASSDLFALDEADGALTSREEVIVTRWWFDSALTVREAALGPVISDAPLLGGSEGRPFVLRWTGHDASDEITAMLRANRARDWTEFRDALDGFWVPGQNMIYADAEGHIGQVLAVRLPARENPLPEDIILPVAAASDWDSFRTANSLPAAYDPPSGYVASANNRPAWADVPIGYFFSGDDRIVRLGDILGGDGKIGIDDLKALQRDVVLPSAIAIRDAVLEALAPTTLDDEASAIVETLRQWDGAYQENSRGALVFEWFMNGFLPALLGNDEVSAIVAGRRDRLYLPDDMAAASAPRLRDALLAGLAAAARNGDGKDLVWGDVHRLGLAHLLGRAPLIGSSYRFADYPVGGTSHSLMKTAHAATDERHVTRFGSQARHISDMSDLDANYFVLLGGSDGWINSDNFMDQAALWRAGEYVRMPLRPETVRAEFPYVTEFTP